MTHPLSEPSSTQQHDKEDEIFMCPERGRCMIERICHANNCCILE